MCAITQLHKWDVKCLLGCFLVPDEFPLSAVLVTLLIFSVLVNFGLIVSRKKKPTCEQSKGTVVHHISITPPLCVYTLIV